MIQQQYDLANLDIIKYNCIANYHTNIKSIFSLIIKKDYNATKEFISFTQDMCKNLKEEAKKNNDEKYANISFLLNRYLLLLKAIYSFWELCDKLDYQDAWNPLQDALDYLRTLRKFMIDENQLFIKQIDNYLQNIEKLYPFIYFNSIELLSKRKVCSICNKSPFDSECSHIAGNLYMGEMATIIIKDAEALGVSLIKNPIDKRCIIFMNCDKNNIENTPFKLINTLIKSLEEPFHLFELELTKRKLPRQYYNAWSGNSFCPCGSEKPFKDCCSDKEVIENPHYEIHSKGLLKMS